MNLPKNTIWGIIFCSALISSALIWSNSNKKSLLKNHQVAIAKITDCSYGGKGHAGTITFLYKFVSNNEEIQGGKTFNSAELNFDDAKSFFLGKTFPVVYNPNNPNNNFLLIRPKDFNQFNYSLPDSLHWILKYIRGN
jgi:hypothetical protein